MKRSLMPIGAAVILLLALGALAHPAHAAGTLTITVKTTLDGIDPTPDDGVCTTRVTDPAHGLCTIRAALQTASAAAAGTNVTVNVPAATQHYFLTFDPGTLTISGPSAGTITISGAQRSGVVIDGSQYPGGIDDIETDSDAVLRNLTITGGISPGAGGGIYMLAGNLTLSNVRITGNQGGASGGIYQQSDGTLTVTNSEIDHNASVNTGCGFLCTVASGGGLYLNAGPANLSYDLIAGNTATGDGGAMFIDNGFGNLVKASNLVIQGNVAQLDGGGIYNDAPYFDAPQMILSNSVVENNKSLNPANDANTSGGGILNDTFLQLINTQVTHNSVGYLQTNVGLGGGIDNDSDGTLTMSGGSISGNTAGFEGGGLINYSTATLTSVPVTGNHAGDTPGFFAAGDGQGGGIYAVNYSTLDLEGGSVSANSAGVFGGGLAIFTNNIQIDGSGITGNVAGGASGCPGFGGGFYMDGSSDVPPTLTLPHPGIHGANISSNNAAEAVGSADCLISLPASCPAGGGVMVLNAALTIDGSAHVNANRACDGAGAYVGTGASLTFSGTMSLNAATGQGGALFVDASSLGATIAGSHITGNRAPQTGGIYNLAPVSITGSLILGNTGSLTCINLLTPCQ